MDKLDDFLAETPEAEEVVTPEVAEAPADAPEGETAEAARERDEKGRFKAKEQADDVMVPLKALHETRDEVKTLKAELERLRQPQAPQEAPPDIFENPEGFQQFQTNQLNSAIYRSNLQWSERVATIEHGQELVAKAKEWGTALCDQNPLFNMAVASQPDPYSFVVREYQRHHAVSQLGNADPNEIEQFVKWREAQKAPQPQPASVPNTLADAQSARGPSEPYSPPTLDQILGRPVT